MLISTIFMAIPQKLEDVHSTNILAQTKQPYGGFQVIPSNFVWFNIYFSKDGLDNKQNLCTSSPNFLCDAIENNRLEK